MCEFRTLFAFKVFGQEFFDRFLDFSIAKFSGSADADDLAAKGMEIHAVSCAGKSDSRRYLN